MKNIVKFLILILVIILGISVYVFKTNTQIEEGSNSLKQEVKDESAKPQTNDKNIYESNLGFSIVIPEGWVPVDGPENMFALIHDSNKDGVFDEGRINEKPYNGKTIFEVSNGKFGKYTLRFSKENNCWMVGEANGKSIFGESCKQPVRYVGTKPIFSIFDGVAYALVNSDTSFVYFDSMSGHTEVLKEIIYSIR
jgi:hypothetical protein